MQNGSVGWRIAVGMCVTMAVIWSGLACAVTNPHGIAVIAGNHDYEHIEDVTFAHRDAEAFGRYAVEILGFDPGRVLYLKDAKKIELETMFGKPGKAVARQRSVGEEFRDCEEGWCPWMVVVTAGEYMMGSPEGEEGRYDNEGPRHEVRIGKPFAVGKYEVTFAEWDACVARGGCGGYRPNDQGWGRGDRPVMNVSWEDAKLYVRWLSRKTGKTYRMLSEAEWEYVARAGTTAAYTREVETGENRANCRGCGSEWDGRETAPVGSFSANGFGLHDMHGNVWEWVEDCWHEDYKGAPSEGEAWTSGGECGKRVLRGGSWHVRPRFLRSALRFRFSAGLRNCSVGFRIARTLTPLVLAALHPALGGQGAPPPGPSGGRFPEGWVSRKERKRLFFGEARDGNQIGWLAHGAGYVYRHVGIFWGGLAQPEVTNPDGVDHRQQEPRADRGRRVRAPGGGGVQAVCGGCPWIRSEPDRGPAGRGVHADEVGVRQPGQSQGNKGGSSSGRNAVRMWWCSIPGTERRV